MLYLNELQKADVRGPLPVGAREICRSVYRTRLQMTIPDKPDSQNQKY